MKKLFNAKRLENFFQIIAIASLVASVFIGQASYAQTGQVFKGDVGVDSGVFGEVNKAFDVSYSNAKLIVYGIAGLAAIALGVGAMFGQFAWKKFFGVVVGIGVIALVDLTLQYLIGEGDVFEDSGAATGAP